MTAEEMKQKWPDDDGIPPKKDMSEKSVPKKDEQMDINSDFRTTILERRLITKRITMLEFQKQHNLGDQAVLRPDTKDLFELGQYVIVIHVKGFPQFDGAGALVINYEKLASGHGSYTIALLGRHAGNDFVNCPANILKACTDEKVWSKMCDDDPELAKDCIFIEFGSDMKNTR